MASKQELVPLIQGGPFKGWDATSSGDYTSPGDAATMSNLNTHRVTGALTTVKGYSQSVITGIQYLTGYPNAGVGAAVAYDISAVQWSVLCSLVNAGPFDLLLINPSASGTTASGHVINPYGTAAFNQGVEFNGTLWLNSGWQINQTGASSFQATLWQYPPLGVQAGGYSYSSASPPYPVLPSTTSGSGLPNGAGGTSYMAAGTYYYAFTMLVKLPNGTYQETTPIGQNAIPYAPTSGLYVSTPYPFAVTVDGSHNVTIMPYFTNPGAGVNTAIPWSGTLPDGSTYTTNVYRQSTITPVWYLLANLTGNSSWLDSVSDPNQVITGSTQMTLAQDVPPLWSGYETSPNLGAIFVHQERVWVFSDVYAQVAGPSGLTNQQYTLNPQYQWQSQLWYSALGTPHQMDSVNQVLLVGNSSTVQITPNYLGYGDNPVAGISMGSIAVLFKSRSTWGVFGNDPSTYVVSRLFDIGCIARNSVISALGTIYWLSEAGVFAFNGGAPQYLSAKIKNFLGSLSMAQLEGCIAAFIGETLILDFGTGGTVEYYTVTGDWNYNGYVSSPSGNLLSIRSNPNTPNPVGGFESYTGSPGQVTSVSFRPNYTTNTPDLYVKNFYSTELANGVAIEGTWQSPLTTSGHPESEKQYEYLTFLIPYYSPQYITNATTPVTYQEGTITFTLTIDPGSYTPKTFTQTFTVTAPAQFEQAQPRYIFRLGPDFKGFHAQLTVDVTNNCVVGAEVPFFIESITVWGLPVDRKLVIPD